MILAKTIKGYGMGEAGEGQNITHQQKKMDEDGAAEVARPLRPGLTDEQVHDAAFVKPADDSAGDGLPARAPHGARRRAAGAAAHLDGAGGPRRCPAFGAQLTPTGEREISTTMAFGLWHHPC